MASVTITFSDTPEGGVAVHSDFVPAAGQHLTPAQAAGLDTYVRGCYQWCKRTKPDAAAVQIANYGAPTERINRGQRHGDHSANPTL